jgi:hypothetical protein
MDDGSRRLNTGSRADGTADICVEVERPVTSSLPPVWVVIVAYRPGPVLADTLQALERQSVPVHTVLVDNDDRGGDVTVDQAVKGREGDVTLLRGHGNVGFARACNLGATEAPEEAILWFLNPDAVPPRHAAEQLAKHLTNSPAAPAIAGTALISPEGGRDASAMRARLTPFSALLEGLPLLRRLWPSLAGKRFLKPLRQSGEGRVACHAVSGASLAISKTDFDALGGFDPGYFLHVEDIDLCDRAVSAGGAVMCLVDVQVVHHRSTSDAPRLSVERAKARGFARYFRQRWPLSPLAWLMSLAAFARAEVRGRRRLHRRSAP